MPSLSISKSSLKKERDRLHMLKRFLPSLDLKRKQLLLAQKAAHSDLVKAEEDVIKETERLEWILELLGAWELDLEGLVTIDSVVIDEQNVVGARLPVAREVKFKTAEYSMLAMPFWVDFLLIYVQQLATMRVHLQVNRERVVRLDLQVRRITQRVNLFERRLIPLATKSIKRIQLGLAEQERSAVVRSKIAKKKHVV